MDDRRTILERLSGKQLADLDAKIRNADSPDQIREVLLRANQYSGTFTREADGFISYGNRDFGTMAPTETTPVSQPKTVEDDGLLRSVWRTPSGALQTCEAASPSGLEVLERSMREWGAVMVAGTKKDTIPL